MKKFYLYLDESGSFDKDHLKLDNPSLVGGYLSTYEVDEKLAIDLLNRPNGLVHSTEMASYGFEDLAISLFKKMNDLALLPVIFENTLRLRIVDGDTTYLNITAEGIILLISKLVNIYGDISLNIIASCRLWIERSQYQETKSNTPIISVEEYKKRLEEKIIIGMVNKNLPNIQQCKWTVITQSARNERKLQVSDVICHSWFRKSGNNKKFHDNNIDWVKSFFNKGYVFNVFIEDIEYKYENHINQGHLAEVIFDLLISSQSSINNNIYDKVMNTLKLYDENNQIAFLKQLFAKIHFTYRININLSIIKKLVNDSLEVLIPKLIEANIKYKLFYFDILFLGLTLATNEGNIRRANDYIIRCDELLPGIINKWENVQYYFDYKLRLGVHLINKYAFDECIEEMNVLEDVISNTLDLFQAHEAFYNMGEVIKSDAKGKMYGIRLMAKTYLGQLIGSEPSLNPVEDSNDAISSFESNTDKIRQYQLRSWVCYTNNESKEAIRWLYKSVGHESKYNYDSVGLRLILEGAKKNNVFLFIHYLGILLTEMDFESNKSLANMMFDIWNKTQSQQFIELNINNYLYHLIHWKLASIYMNMGRTKAAIEKYDMAEKLTHSISYNKDGSINQTLYSTLIAIKVDKIYRIYENKSNIGIDKELKLLRNTLDKIIKSNLPKEMLEIIEDIMFNCNKAINGDYSFIESMYFKSKAIVVF